MDDTHDSAYIERVLAIVAEEFDVTVADILGHSRKGTITHARRTAIYVLHKEVGLRQHQIANALGNRDHTTIMHALERFPTVQEMYPRHILRIVRRARMAAIADGALEYAPEEPIKDWIPCRDLGSTFMWGGRTVRAVTWNPARQLVGITYQSRDNRTLGVQVPLADLRYPYAQRQG